jgi:hypothetical protein
MGNLEWAWKDPDNKEKVKPVIKKVVFGKKRRKRAKKQARNNLNRLPADGFYVSKEWRRLRYRVIKKYDASCMACGRSKKHHGIVIHVDHIKPRSKYPDLALHFNNLQLLCADCNLGKSNKCEVDWRPDEVDAEREILNDAMKHI